MQGTEVQARADQQRSKKLLEAEEEKACRLQLSQRSLEGELQRAQLRVAKLESEAGVLHERLAELKVHLGLSEDRCTALALGQEQLSASLAHAEQQESQLKEQNGQLTRSLTDSRSGGDDLQRQAVELQGALAASEHDRRRLQVSNLPLSRF